MRTQHPVIRHCENIHGVSSIRDIQYLLTFNNGVQHSVTSILQDGRSLLIVFGLPSLTYLIGTPGIGLTDEK